MVTSDAIHLVSLFSQLLDQSSELNIGVMSHSPFLYVVDFFLK
jgi:hypothetical protein